MRNLQSSLFTTFHNFSQPFTICPCRISTGFLRDRHGSTRKKNVVVVCLFVCLLCNNNQEGFKQGVSFVHCVLCGQYTLLFSFSVMILTGGRHGEFMRRRKIRLEITIQNSTGRDFLNKFLHANCYSRRRLKAYLIGTSLPVCCATPCLSIGCRVCVCVILSMGFAIRIHR